MLQYSEKRPSQNILDPSMDKLTNKIGREIRWATSEALKPLLELTYMHQWWLLRVEDRNTRLHSPSQSHNIQISALQVQVEENESRENTRKGALISIYLA